MHLVDITMFYAEEGGGVSTYLNAKARWLARRGRVRHTILSPNIHSRAGSPALVEIPAVGLPFVNGYRMPLSVHTPARLLRQLQPDLIEAGDAGHCAWAALAARRRLHVPVVAFYHSDLPRLLERRLGKLAESAARHYLAQLYRQFDMVLAPSRLMVQQLAGSGIGDAVYQPLGIDAGIFSPEQRDERLRKLLALPPETRLLAYAGRFTPEKKLHLLVEAVGRLGKPYHLLLIGSGAPVPRTAQTTIIPFQRDQRRLARLLASCDLLVHPGDCETFGLVALEAMACGLPVVGTGGGVAELLDAQTGIVVPPDSAASLCEGIEAIYQRDRARMGQLARRKAADHYDWNQIMPQLLTRYAGLLATRERADLEEEYACAVD